jgi:hypothetical protein
MDLGNGYRLVIQVNFNLNPNLNRYRAVVKDASGTVVAQGSVTSLDDIAESRQQATLEYVDKVLKPLEKPEGDFADDYTANDEDED